jgi:hypothetical protein
MLCIIARHTMLHTMRPFILPGTILFAAGLTVLPATAHPDTALKDLMPKGVVGAK